MGSLNSPEQSMQHPCLYHTETIEKYLVDMRFPMYIRLEYLTIQYTMCDFDQNKCEANFSRSTNIW